MQRQTGRMIGHAAYRGVGGVAHAGHQLDVAQVVVDRLVEIDLPALDERHQPRCRDGLGNRGQRVHGVLVGGAAILSIGPAEAFLPEDLAFAGDGDGQRRDAAVGQCVLDQCADRVELIGASVSDQRGDQQRRENRDEGATNGHGFLLLKNETRRELIGGMAKRRLGRQPHLCLRPQSEGGAAAPAYGDICTQPSIASGRAPCKLGG